MRLSAIFFLLAQVSFSAWGNPIRILAPLPADVVAPGALVAKVKSLILERGYREIRLQPILKAAKLAYVLVYLHSKQSHRVDFLRLKQNTSHEWVVLENSAELLKQELHSQPGKPLGANACPEPLTQFVVVVPAAAAEELQAAQQVAAAAKNANLKTVELYNENATRDAFFDYLSCPNLRGVFYDGDAYPTALTVYDGLVGADDITARFSGKWNFRVTHIWVACDAYNPIMREAVETNAQAKKFGSGMVPLKVGPSDRTAACAMEAALAGQAMTPAFIRCFQKYGDPPDEWPMGGEWQFTGKGSDFFFE